jgi:hypothetical protein
MENKDYSHNPLLHQLKCAPTGAIIENIGKLLFPADAH